MLSCVNFIVKLTFCWDGAGCDDAPGDKLFSPSALLLLLGSSATCFLASENDKGFD